MSKSGNLTIVLQAGGESRRMGRSKATVPFLGEPLIWRGINRLLPLADEFIITTNEPENLDFLDDLVELGKVRLVTDEYDQRGALRGVYTAINAASNEYVALVACDMVFPSRNLISAELEALMEEETDVAVPKTKHGYEPFHAVYRRSSCLPVVREATEAGVVRQGQHYGVRWRPSRPGRATWRLLHQRQHARGALRRPRAHPCRQDSRARGVRVGHPFNLRSIIASYHLSGTLLRFCVKTPHCPFNGVLMLCKG